MRVDPSPASAVEVYWRPGCGFCSTLLRGLRRSGLPLRAVDIWRDPEAAALVRSLAGGNETVPTVVIGALMRWSTRPSRRSWPRSPTRRPTCCPRVSPARHRRGAGRAGGRRCRRSGWRRCGRGWRSGTRPRRITWARCWRRPPGRGWSAGGPAGGCAYARWRSPPLGARWSPWARLPCSSRWAACAARTWSATVARPPNRWCCSASAAPTGLWAASRRGRRDAASEAD
jgi:mycoredoxin